MYQDIKLDILKRCSKSNGNVNSKLLKEEDRNFLSSSFPHAKTLHEQFYCLKNDIFSPPKCTNCDNFTNYSHYGYRKNCSIKCARSSKEALKLREETNLKRYGVTNAINASNIRDRWKKKLIENYGVDNPSKIEENKKKISTKMSNKFNNLEEKNKILNKRKTTCKKKYGVDSYSKTDEFNEKSKSTCKKKYGVDSYSKTDEFKENYKNTCIERYGVKNVFQNEDIKNKIKTTSLEKYGTKNPGASKESRLRAKNTTLEKYGRPYYTQLHIPQNLWELSQSNVEVQKLYEEVGVYGIIKKYPEITIPWWIKILKKHNIDISNSRSYLELEIYNFLKSIPNISIKTNDRKILSPLEIDFLINDKIGIEIHGLYWHSEKMGKDRNYHLNKTKASIVKNIRLIQIFEDEWINSQDICKSRILSSLGLCHKINARSCVVKEITSEDKNKFLSENHIQHNDKSCIYLGLLYNDELISVMTFGKSRYNKSYDYELLRFCSKKNIVIRGGASKLFKYFLRTYNPSSIVSYCDRRWGEGNTYINMGMNFEYDSKPNYFYISNRIRRESRIKYQKHKLKNILKEYDENKSEWENMNNNGYDRIWDCGNKVFTWRK